VPVLTSLTVNLKGDSSSLVRATRTGLRSLRGLTRGVAGTIAKVGGLATAITGISGGVGLGVMAAQASRSLDAIGKLSTQLGVSGTDVQKIGLIAELSGVKTESLSKAMQRVTRLVGDAAAGGKQATELFERLGLSVEDLEKLSALERFRKVAGALNQLGSATEKASIGNKLFEEQWQRLNPLLEGFEGNMRRAIAVFDTMRFGIGDRAKPVEALNDNFTVIGKSIAAFRDLVFSKASPALNFLVVTAGRAAEEFIKAKGGADQLADSLINNVIDKVEKTIEVFDQLKEGLAFLSPVGGALKTLVDTQAGIAAGAAALARGEFAGAGRIAGEVFDNVFGASTPGDSEATKELEKQTQLLRQVVDNGATGFFR